MKISRNHDRNWQATLKDGDVEVETIALPTGEYGAKAAIKWLSDHLRRKGFRVSDFDPAGRRLADDIWSAEASPAR
ncbi:hypothetical protein [Leifsonia sp. Leaf264]|uniref:hypothetical protein n=1 Tax=Leifsonia sp. Leaf264 TaxID=1736314 RepID=UPI000B068990|nr:hypothetical protein [Leifsonia sp. Leaf264]